MTGRGTRNMAAWTVTLGVSGLILRLAGDGGLGLSTLGDPFGWASWVERVGPVAAAFSVVRLLAVGAWLYLVVVTTAGTALRLARAHTLVSVLDRLTPPALRRLLASTVGGITLAVSSGGASLAWTAPPDRTPTTVVAVGTSTGSDALADSPLTLTMKRLTPSDGPAASNGVDNSDGHDNSTGDQPSTPPVTTGPNPTMTMRHLAPGEERRDAAQPATAWTVAPGESFWSRAEAVVASSGPTGNHPGENHPGEGKRHPTERRPTDADIGSYWLRLIEANRSKLADAANPDLIFPGQVFVLPDA